MLYIHIFILDIYSLLVYEYKKYLKVLYKKQKLNKRRLLWKVFQLKITDQLLRVVKLS